MADSLELLHAVQSIEAQLNVIKKALNDMGIKDEGVIGTFDGEFMILENGRRFPIPPNYASKSMLVPGDTLRLIEDPNGGEQHRFKQIAKAERGKATGLLARKDGKFEVICEEGSFKVLTAAIKHFEGEPGDQVTIQFAKNHTKGSWAAVEKVHKAGGAPSLSFEPDPSTVSSGQSNWRRGNQLSETNDQPSTFSGEAGTTRLASQPQPPVSSSMLTGMQVQSPTQSIAHAEPEVAPTAQAPSAEPQEQPQSEPGRKAAAAGPRSNPGNRSSNSSRSSKSKSSSGSRSKSGSPRPAERPAPALTPQQGEIAISSVMDDDDLA